MSTVPVDRHTHGLRERGIESHPWDSLIYCYGAFLWGFLWPIIVIFLALSLYLVYLRILPCMFVHLLAKMNSSEEAYGSWHHLVWGDVPSLFDLQGLLRMCMGEVSLTSRMRNMWSFISYLGRAQPPPSSCYYGVFVHRGETVQPVVVAIQLCPTLCNPIDCSIPGFPVLH